MYIWYTYVYMSRVTRVYIRIYGSYIHMYTHIQSDTTYVNEWHDPYIHMCIHVYIWVVSLCICVYICIYDMCIHMYIWVVSRVYICIYETCQSCIHMYISVVSLIHIRDMTHIYIYGTCMTHMKVAKFMASWLIYIYGTCTTDSHIYIWYLHDSLHTRYLQKTKSLISPQKSPMSPQKTWLITDMVPTWFIIWGLIYLWYPHDSYMIRYIYGVMTHTYMVPSRLTYIYMVPTWHIWYLHDIYGTYMTYMVPTWHIWYLHDSLYEDYMYGTYMTHIWFDTYMASWIIYVWYLHEWLIYIWYLLTWLIIWGLIYIWYLHESYMNRYTYMASWFIYIWYLHDWLTYKYMAPTWLITHMVPTWLIYEDSCIYGTYMTHTWFDTYMASWLIYMVPARLYSCRCGICMTHLYIFMHIWYRVAKMHRMPYLETSFSAKEPYN